MKMNNSISGSFLDVSFAIYGVDYVNSYLIKDRTCTKLNNNKE